MKSTKQKSTKRVVKGWALIDKQMGHLKSTNGIFWGRGEAEKAIDGTWPYAIVQITISYVVPAKRKKV